MPFERKFEYINRWLIRHPVNKGWMVNANEKAYGYWMHKTYIDALDQALSGQFTIKETIEYGDLKAILYERKL
jgi:hypothetical protein